MCRDENILLRFVETKKERIRVVIVYSEMVFLLENKSDRKLAHKTNELKHLSAPVRGLFNVCSRKLFRLCFFFNSVSLMPTHPLFDFAPFAQLETPAPWKNTWSTVHRTPSLCIRDHQDSRHLPCSSRQPVNSAKPSKTRTDEVT